jgi:hypothetical protein
VEDRVFYLKALLDKTCETASEPAVVEVITT